MVSMLARKQKPSAPAGNTLHGQAWRNSLKGYLFILPSLAGCAIFVVIPFAQVIWRSLTDGITQRFVGLAHYAEIFRNQAFMQAAGNTLKFMGVCVPLLLLLSLMLAILLDREVLGRAGLRAAFLVPMAVPVASVALLWQVLFHENGVMNNVLEAFGLDRIEWMRTNWAFACFVVSYIWKNIGYNMVLFIAGLSNISPSYYEAAAVDGATTRQQFWHITLPCLKPVFFTVTVLSMLNSFKAYREVYLVAGNYPHGSIYLIQHTFNNWFTAMEIEKLSAGATVTAAVILALVGVLSRAWRAEASVT